jgi:hypothetical protein
MLAGEEKNLESDWSQEAYVARAGGFRLAQTRNQSMRTFYRLSSPVCSCLATFVRVDTLELL